MIIYRELNVKVADKFMEENKVDPTTYKAIGWHSSNSGVNPSGYGGVILYTSLTQVEAAGLNVYCLINAGAGNTGIES